MCLYSIIDHSTGLAKFSTRRKLLTHFRLGSRTRLIITASAEDRSVEHFWHMLRVKETVQSLLALQPALITTPNYSMHLDTVRHDNLLSMARIAYYFEAFAGAGLPVSPHINARTRHDFERWISSEPMACGAINPCGTIGAATTCLASPRRIITSVRFVGCIRQFDFVDSSPLMKAKQRQVATIEIRSFTGRNLRQWLMNRLTIYSSIASGLAASIMTRERPGRHWRSGASAALIAPNVDTGTMNQFLRILKAERKPDEHIVLIIDRAGWHFRRPTNIFGVSLAVQRTGISRYYRRGCVAPPSQECQPESPPAMLAKSELTAPVRDASLSPVTSQVTSDYPSVA